MKHLFSILLSGFILSNTLFAQQKVIHEYKLEGNGKYDYLTSGKDNKLYVSHGDRVQVMDKTNGKLLASIIGLSGVHGIALDYKNGKGFISNGTTNLVTVFDNATNKILNMIATEQNPDAIIYEPFSKKIIVGNGKSHTLTIIDPISEKAIQTIAIDGKPEAMVSDLKGQLYVNIEDKNEVEIVDLTTSKTVKSIALSPTGESPTGLAIDLKRKYLYVGCKNEKLLVVDLTKSAITHSFSIGGRCDGVAFDAIRNKIYTSNGIGTLSCIAIHQNFDSWQVSNIPTTANAKTLALDNKTGQVFLSAAETGETDNAGKILPKPSTFKVLVVE